MRVAARGPPWLETSLIASRPRVKGVVYPSMQGGFVDPAPRIHGPPTPSTRSALTGPATREPREWQLPGFPHRVVGGFRLRWATTRSVSKPGLRRKGGVHPQGAPRPGFSSFRLGPLDGWEVREAPIALSSGRRRARADFDAEDGTLGRDESGEPGTR